MIYLTKFNQFVRSHILYFQLSALLCHFSVLYFLISGDRKLSDFFIIISAAILFELAVSYLFERKWISPVSGAIAMMGLYLHIQTRYVIWPYIFGVLVASLSKKIIRINDKQVFNPSNLAIMIIVLCMSDLAFVNLSQWYGFAPLFIYFLAVGSFITFYANKIILSYSYLMTIITLRYLMSYFVDLPVGYLVGTAVAFNNYVFAFHMITDPKTSPSSWRGQIAFGIFIAFLDFIFRYMEIVFAPFLALFIACALRALIPSEYFEIKNLKKFISFTGLQKSAS